MAVRFANREQAAELLAAKLIAYAHRSDVLVLALPRGGVPVGFVLARTFPETSDARQFSHTKEDWYERVARKQF